MIKMDNIESERKDSIVKTCSEELIFVIEIDLLLSSTMVSGFMSFSLIWMADDINDNSKVQRAKGFVSHIHSG